MGDALRRRDWSNSPLGDIWPTALYLPVSIALSSNQPMFIAWGGDCLGIYNDACIPLIGGPARAEALPGRPVAEAFPEIWGNLSVCLGTVMQTGEPVQCKDQPITVQRADKTEHCIYTFTLNPIRNEIGEVEGVFAVLVDTTRDTQLNPALESLVESAPLAIVVFARDGRVRLWNQGAERTFGWKAEEVIGGLSPTVPLEYLPDFFDSLEEAAQGTVYNRRASRQRKDGTPIEISFSTAALRNGEGNLEGFVTMVADVTDQVHAEQGLKLLDRANAALNASLDYEATLNALVVLAVSSLADWCVVNLLEADGSINPAALAHLDKTREPLLRQWIEEAPARLEDPDGTGAVIRTGGAKLISRFMEVVDVHSPDIRRMIEEIDCYSLMMVPLKANDHIMGAVSFARGRNAPPYTDYDLSLAQDLANRAALAIANARYFRQAETAVRRTTQLQKVTSALSKAVTPEEVAVVALEQGTQVLGATAGWFMVRAGQDTYQAIYGIGHEPELMQKALYQPRPLTQGSPLTEAIRLGQPQWIETLDERQRRFPVQSAEDTKPGTWVTIPLVVKGESIGGIGLTFPQFGPVPEEDRNFMMNVAEQCAQALERARLYEDERRARHRSDNILNSITDGFIALDHEWRYTYVNPRAEQLLRTPRERLLGSVIWDIFPPQDDFTRIVERNMRRAAAEDTTLEFEGYSTRFGVWFAIRVFPANDGVVAYFQDITERKRARQQEQFLADLSLALSGSLDLAARLENLTRAIAPEIADWCFVELVDETGNFTQAAIHHRDPARVEEARLWRQGYDGLSRLKALREPLLIPTIEAVQAGDEDRLQAWKRAGLQSILYLPLSAGDTFLGLLMLAVSAESGRRYTADDLPFAAEIARRASLAIDNARLYQQAQAARAAAEANAERVTRLQAITANLASALTFEEVARVILEQGVPALDADAGNIALLDETRQYLGIISAVGYPEEIVSPYRQFPATTPSPLGDAVGSRKPVWILSRDDWYARYDRQPGDPRHHMFAALPLLVNGQPIGGIGFSFETERAVSAEDRAFATAVAEQCAQAIERARLYEAERRAREQAEFNANRVARLQTYTADLSNALTIEQVVAVTLRRLLPGVGAAGGNVMLLRDGMLELVQTTGYTPTQIAGWTRFPITIPMALSDAVRSGQPQWVVSRDDWQARFHNPPLSQYQSWAAIPLKVEGRTVAALGLSFEHANSFPEADRLFIEAMAEQCAQALERARLYEAERRAQERQRFLAEASAELFRSLDYEVTLQKVSSLAVPRIADWCAIDIIQGDTFWMVGVDHPDPTMRELAYDMRRRWPPVVSEATFKPTLVPEITDEMLVQGIKDPEQLEIFRRLHLSSAISVPLAVNDKPIGLLSLYYDTGKHYTMEDLDFAAELARRAAIAIENARLYEEIERQRQWLQVTVSSIGDAVIATDRAGNVIFMNPVAQELTGWPETDAAGVPLETVFHIVNEETHAIVENPFTKVLRENAVVGLANHTLLITRAGREIPIDDSGAPIRDADSDIIGVILVFRDVTERREAQLAELKQRTLAEALRDTALALTSTLKRDDVLRHILANIGRVVPHDFADILLIENDGAAVIVGNHGYEQNGFSEMGSQMVGLRMEIARMPLLSQMSETGQPVVVPDTRQLAGWQNPLDKGAVRGLVGAPVIIQGKVAGFLLLSSRQPDFFTEESARNLATFANQASIAIQNADLYVQAQHLAVLEDRQRLARDLHDAVTQTLFSANLIAEVIPRMWTRDPHKALERLQLLHQLTSGALAEMRTLLVELRPSTLMNTALKDLLTQLTDAVRGRKHINVRLKVEGQAELPPDVHMIIYRIAQEALNNVMKHSAASEVEVSLLVSEARVELTVQDNGKGFATSESYSGIGLGSMRERAADIGATLDITSAPGEGTRVRAVWEAT
jgi:PAS domain S-box-containing protein